MKAANPQLGDAYGVPADKGGVSAPLLWLSLRDWRLAVGSDLAPSIPVFRSVRDYSQRA
jgi:hypothetical protein